MSASPQAPGTGVSRPRPLVREASGARAFSGQKPEPRTTIESHPWLTVLFGSSHPLLCLGFAIPLSITLASFGVEAELSTAAWLGWVALGIFYWSFVEYAMHRWFYHWRPRSKLLRRMVESFHVYHHRNIPDRRVWNAGPFLALPLTVILGAPWLLLTFSLTATATLMLGTVIGYYIYEWFHYAVHIRTYQRGPLAYMQRFHLHHHHEDWGVNFGVSNPCWDILFRTARSPRTDP